MYMYFKDLASLGEPKATQGYSRKYEKEVLPQ